MDAETAKPEADADDGDADDTNVDNVDAADVNAKQPARGEGDAKQPANGETATVEADAGDVGQPANTSAARNKTAKTFSAKAAEVLLEHIAEQRWCLPINKRPPPIRPQQPPHQPTVKGEDADG